MTDTTDGCPSIDEVKAHQSARAIPGHLAWLGRERFVLAHTDAERASGMPLDRCRVHRALADLDEHRGEAGYHLAEMVDGQLVLTPLSGEDDDGYARLAAAQDDEDRAFHAAIRGRPRGRSADDSQQPGL